MSGSAEQGTTPATDTEAIVSELSRLGLLLSLLMVQTSVLIGSD